jgi:hypothetical protein
MLKIFILIFSISSMSEAHVLLCKQLFFKELPPLAKTSSLDAIFVELPNYILRGKNAIRSSEFGVKDRAYFESILALKESDLEGLSNHQLLDIYGLFAKWNLLAPARFSKLLFSVIRKRLENWSSGNYRSFALSRKLSPEKLPAAFLQKMKSEMIKKFAKLDVETQMEVFGAELFQQTYFSSQEMAYMFEQTTKSLMLSSNVIRLKPLKELYRALLLLRVNEPTVFFEPMLLLEAQLERKMNAQNLSFNEDGTSGANNLAITKPYKRVQLEQRLADLFVGESKIEEYSNPGVLGFYDPVDIFYPDLMLVVEWDGRHHYFRKLVETDGRIADLIEGGLRVIDKVKDHILRRQGYRILRVSYLINHQLDTANLLDLIQQQNP